MRETSRRRIRVTSSFNTEGKAPHEREGKGGGHMRETSRRRITGYVVFEYRGKYPHERGGKGGHT